MMMIIIASTRQLNQFSALEQVAKHHEQGTTHNAGHTAATSTDEDEMFSTVNQTQSNNDSSFVLDLFLQEKRRDLFRDSMLESEKDELLLDGGKTAEGSKIDMVFQESSGSRNGIQLSH